jgi:hypothetical protein
VGGLLAALRVCCWLYLSRRVMTHTWSVSLSSVSDYLIALYPEAPAMSVMGGISPAWDLSIGVTVLAALSFFWTTPLLLVGAARRD